MQHIAIEDKLLIEQKFWDENCNGKHNYCIAVHEFKSSGLKLHLFVNNIILAASFTKFLLS